MLEELEKAEAKLQEAKTTVAMEQARKPEPLKAEALNDLGHPHPWPCPHTPSPSPLPLPSSLAALLRSVRATHESLTSCSRQANGWSMKPIR